MSERRLGKERKRKDKTLVIKANELSFCLLDWPKNTGEAKDAEVEDGLHDQPENRPNNVHVALPEVDVVEVELRQGQVERPIELQPGGHRLQHPQQAVHVVDHRVGVLPRPRQPVLRRAVVVQGDDGGHAQQHVDQDRGEGVAQAEADRAAAGGNLPPQQPPADGQLQKAELQLGDGGGARQQGRSLGEGRQGA